MDTVQALKVVIAAAEKAALPKQDHVIVEQAYDLLLKALLPEVSKTPHPQESAQEAPTPQAQA